MPQLFDRSSEEKIADSVFSRSQRDVVDYYRQTISDYQVWSQAGFMHFGFWRSWSNPLNRDAMLRAMNDLVFECLGLEQDQPGTVGDFGCGVGAVSIDGAMKFPNHKWRAFTICPEQVAFGNRLLIENAFAPERVKVEKRNFSDTGIGDESYDGVFFLESICHTEDLTQTLAESFRVLKPGGRLVVVDGMMSKTPSETPGWVNRLASKVCESWAVPQFHARPSFEAACESIGFEILNQQEVGWSIVPCVAHSPILVGWHSLKLMLQRRFTSWKRKHMLGCALGILLGMIRWQFGYYVYTLQKPA